MTENALDHRVTIGVDTHPDVHVAVALDERGVRLREIHVPTALGANHAGRLSSARAGPSASARSRSSGARAAATTGVREASTAPIRG